MYGNGRTNDFTTDVPESVTGRSGQFPERPDLKRTEGKLITIPTYLSGLLAKRRFKEIAFMETQALDTFQTHLRMMSVVFHRPPHQAGNRPQQLFRQEHDVSEEVQPAVA